MLIQDPPQSLNKPDAMEAPLVLSGSAEYLETCSLVLNAVGIPHALNPHTLTLTVAEKYSKAARHQLEQYFRENSGWPEKPAPARVPFQKENPPTLLMIGGLVIFFMITGSWQDHVLWFRLGAIDSQAILEQRQWWRLVTALTLHADQVHLIGNCVIGGFLVHLLCKSIGSGLGWLTLIFCGALGNLLNILLRDQAHHSVGFSTSIFAAIGLFTGLQMIIGSKMRFKELIAPLGAGAALLAMLGTEGEQTDLGAHFFGFACGLVFGFLLNHFDIQKLTDNAQLQRMLFILTLFVILTSWVIAWR